MTSGSVRAMTSSTDMPSNRFRTLFAFLEASSSSALCRCSAVCSAPLLFVGRPLFFFVGVTSTSERRKVENKPWNPGLTVKVTKKETTAAAEVQPDLQDHKGPTVCDEGGSHLEVEQQAEARPEHSLLHPERTAAGPDDGAGKTDPW